MTQDGGVRRETQDENWAAFFGEPSKTQEDLIERVIRAKPELADFQIRAIIPESLIRADSGVSGGRRRLVKAGRVKWTGKTVRGPSGRQYRTWEVGKDTDEEISCTRRWPLVYTEIRRAVDAGNLGSERMTALLRRAADRLEAGVSSRSEVRESLFRVTVVAVAAIEQIDKLAANTANGSDGSKS